MKHQISSNILSTVISLPILKALNFLFGGFDNLLLVLITILSINIILDNVVAFKNKELTYYKSLKILGLQLLNLLLIVVANMLDMAGILDVVSLRLVVMTYLLVTSILKTLSNMSILGVEIPSFLLKLLNNRKDEIDKSMNSDDDENDLESIK